MVNQQTLQGHWNEIKGGLKQRWGQLADEDLQAFQGDIDQLIGLIQRKTGEGREAIEQYLDELMSRSSVAFDRAGEVAREYSHRAAEAMRESYEQASQRLHSGYTETENLVRQRPAESVGAAFCTGLIAGVIVGLVIRSR